MIRLASASMSLVAMIKNPAGLVLAAESGATWVRIDSNGTERRNTSCIKTKKILTFAKPHNFVAAVSYGRATIGGKTVDDLHKEFEMKLPRQRLPVKTLTEGFSKFLMEKWDKSPDKSTYGAELATLWMRFFIGGFDENKRYGCAYVMSIPDVPIPLEKSGCDDKEVYAAVGGWGWEAAESQISSDRASIYEMSLPELAIYAKSCIETIIDGQGKDENGNQMIVRPVIVCKITANDGLHYFNTV